MDHNIIKMYNYNTGEVLEIDKSDREVFAAFIVEGIEWLKNDDTVTIVTNHHEVMFYDLFKYIK